MISVDPTTEKEIQRYAVDEPWHLERKADRAIDALTAWSTTSLLERASLLRALGAQLEQTREDHAQWMTTEMGKVITQSRAEVDKCAWLCRHFAEAGPGYLAAEPVKTEAFTSEVRYRHLGVILGIMPWNFPFWQVLRFAVPTVLAGNVVLLKHAPNVTGCSLAIDELFRAAGFPTGVFQSLLVDTQATGELIEDPRIAGVSLTGSTEAGRHVAQRAAGALKPTVLELGGSDPFVVLADADLHAAARTGAKSRTIANGQSCIAAKRFIVESSVHDPFVELLAYELRELTVGDPRDEHTELGPLAREDLLDNLARQVSESCSAGAIAVCGGERMTRPGYYFPATVLTHVEPGMVAAEEEVFGPVAAVMRAHDSDDAIRLANHTQYGLGASLWTARERGADLAGQLEAGNVFVNSMVKSDPRLPFGGLKQSGLGRELGRRGARAFTNVETVWVD